MSGSAARTGRLAGVAGACAAAFALAEWLDVQLARKAIEPSEAMLAVSAVALGGGAAGLALRALAFAQPLRLERWRGRHAVAVFAALAGLLGSWAAAHALARDFTLGEKLPQFTRTAVAVSLLLAALGASAALYWTKDRARDGRWAGAALWALAAALAVSAPFGRVGGALAVCGLALAALLAARFASGVAVASAAVLAATCALHWPRLALPPAPERPRAAAPGSAILIVLDTVRRDALGPYGAPRGASPAFDAVAAQGVRFEQAIAPSSWTVPVHASLFTGLPPRVHGVGMHSTRRLAGSVVTLAEELAARGFDTVGLSGNPWLRVGNMFQGFARAASTNFSPRDELGLTTLMRYTGVGFDLWIDDGGEETKRELARWLAARDARRPFFLFVNLFEAHDPYLPPIRFRSGGPRAWLGGMRAARRLRHESWHEAGPRAAWEIRALRALYDGEVRFQDAQLGELIALLGAHLDLGGVHLVVTADHGENFGEGERWGHILDVNDLLIRVPLVMTGPAVPAPRVDRTQRNLLDVNQTLRRLTGLPPAGAGRDLLQSGGEPWPFVVSEYVPDHAAMVELRQERKQHAEGVDWPVRALRTPRWKLTAWGSGRAQLHELARDPLEERDLSRARPGLAAELRGQLDAWLAAHPEKLPRDPRKPSGADIPEAERERLRALGYL